jgi:hypothetical protein
MKRKGKQNSWKRKDEETRIPSKAKKVYLLFL